MADLNARLRLQLIDEVSRRAAAMSGALEGVETQAEAIGSTSSAAFERFETGAEQAATSVQRLANEAREAQSVTRTFERGFQNFGSQAAASTAQAARSAQSFGAATQQSFGQGARAAQAMTGASRANAFALAGNVNTAAELVFSFGQLSPATRGLGLAFAMAGGNAFAMAGTFGTMGVVVGTLIGILPGLIDLFRRVGDGASAAAERTRQATERYQELQDTIRSARLERERLEAIASGEASVGEIQDEIGARQAQIRDADRERRDVDQTESRINAVYDLVFGRAGREALTTGAGVGAITRTANILGFGGVSDIGAREAAGRQREQAARSAQEAQRRLEAARGGLGVAQARERREEQERAAQRLQEREQAVSTELEDRIRRRLGPGERASQLAAALRGAATGEGRVELEGRAARTFRRLPESERAELEQLATLFQGVREARVRQESTLRSQAIATARGDVDAARVTEERFRPGVDLAAGGAAEAARIRQEYIAALAESPLARIGAAAERDSRLEEGLTRIGDGIDRLTTGGATVVDVRVRGQVEEATVSPGGGPSVRLDLDSEVD